MSKQKTETLVAPSGYTLTHTEQEIHLKGPFDADLHKRIKRAGGRWDVQSGGNTRAWIVPLDKAKSLKRILANWGDAGAKKAIEHAERERDSELQRWLGYVEEAASGPRPHLYEKGVSRLHSLSVSKHPEYQARLESAIAAVSEAEQKHQEQEQARRQEREQALVADRAKAVYLNVPYADKDLAKSHGAKWDPARRQWYVVGEVPAELGQYDLRPQALPEGHLRISAGSGYGGTEFFVGQTFRHRGDDHDSIVTVVSARKRYYREDGLSFGVGDESGYVYYATVRPATDDEAKPVLDREQAAAERKQIRERVKALSLKFRDTGERPPATQVLEGERLLDAQSIYGGGDWWVIEADAIWYVLNNGADGDDWSHNNVRTGGAGAIGWKLPRTDADEAILREAHRKLSAAIH